MHNMKRIVSTTLISVLLIALAVPGFSFADSSNRDDDTKEKGKSAAENYMNNHSAHFNFDKMIKDFDFMDGKKIRVHHKNVNFDVNPVIKSGRTLIPVRAITEAMGATVEWYPETSIVKIISEDTETTILFNLDSGLVTVNGIEKTIDVKPGMINNRTFVPLRFIAETLGFNVSHDEITKEINCDKDDRHDSEKPVLDTKGVDLTDSDIEDVVVKVDMNDHKLASVKNTTTTPSVLVLTDSYTVDHNRITFKESFIKSLAAGKTILTLVFEAIDKELVNLDFTIEK